jgi:hypothetical protein
MFVCPECSMPMTVVPDDEAFECIPCDTATPVRISDSDRTALSTAAFELRERRSAYETRLKRAELLHGEQFDGIDPFVTESYRDSVKACDEAAAVCERLAKGGG